MSTVFYCEGGIALKTMEEDANPDAVTIYQNDLKVLQSVGQHPYIVRLQQTTDEAWVTHTTTGTVEKVNNCQVLEAVHGGELFYHIVRHGPFSKETARGFLEQLISGVARIHEAGYIHRDLKPWNIILSDDHSQVKIIDFGLATPLDKSQRQYPFNTFMSGTKQYHCPETIIRTPELEGEVLKADDLSKVDTFALGVILINMLTGGYIFENCMSEEYAKLTTDTDYMILVLRNKMI